MKGRPMSTDLVPITASVAQEAVSIAARAPSVHNTQPWSFRRSDGGIVLSADHDRQLRVADESGRELAVSCGAALYTLRLALRAKELEPLVELLPEAGDPRVLARVTARPGAPMSGSERRMLAAVTRRHTHRGRFTGGPAARSLLVELQATAAGEGASLLTVESPGQLRRVLDLVAAADRRQRLDPTWREELA